MRSVFKGLLGSACIALTLGAGATPSAAEAVGLVQRLQNTVYGTPPAGAKAPKYRRDGIEYREFIETAKNSAIEIGFVDGSDLTIGAGAQLTIDTYVFDQDLGSGAAVLTLTQGTLRWITGIMPAGGVRFETPTATITIRGTNVKVGVKLNGDSLIGLDEGEVTVVPKGQGDPVKLTNGESARVTAAGIEVLQNVLSVADPIVDDGWSRATEFGHDRDSKEGRGGSSGQ